MSTRPTGYNPAAARSACTLNQEHCESCGSTSNEDLYGPDADQGYTGCCNELSTFGGDCRGHHLEN